MLIDRRILLVIPAVLCARTALAQWTPYPAAEMAFYISSSGGSDTNPGTEAAPFRTLARGYAALRDGHADAVYLKAGDMWAESFPAPFAKGAGAGKGYMTVGAYGLTPGAARPRLRVSSSAIYGGNAGKSGLAILDLDLAPQAPGSQYAGLTFFQPWSRILIEGCVVSGFPVNIVCQETGAGRLSSISIRNCVVTDSQETGSAHSQGIFWGSVDGGTIEGCVLDRNAVNRADMFCHNAYLHETCGWSIFRGNITARATSHGVQQRSGGIMEGNLALNNPINLFQGGAAGYPNMFRWNVAIGSRDINAIDTRGQGFMLGGGPALIEGNIAAHQLAEGGGSAAVTAFDFDGSVTPVVRGNIVYDWTAPHLEGWATAFQLDSGAAPAEMTGNLLAMPRHGMVIRHEGWVLGSGFNYHDNRYWSTNPASGYEQFSSAAGQGGDWPWWRARAGEAGTVFADPGAFDATMAAYMAHLGRPGAGAAEFLAEARLLARNYDRPEYRAEAVTAWVRGVFGMGGPGACYADFDRSGGLEAGDFQAFLNAYAAASPSANCDGSAVAPTLNANDFQCFLNSYAAGCP